MGSTPYSHGRAAQTDVQTNTSQQARAAHFYLAWLIIAALELGRSIG